MNVHQDWYVRLTVVVGISDLLLSIRRMMGSIPQRRKNIYCLTTSCIKMSLKFFRIRTYLLINSNIKNSILQASQAGNLGIRHVERRPVILSAAKGLAHRTKRSFAALRMTTRCQDGNRTPLMSAHVKPSLHMSSWE